MASDESKTVTDKATGLATYLDVFRSREGKILLAGLGLAAAHTAVILGARIWSRDVSGSLLSMTGACIVGGRAAGISLGYAQALSRWAVMLATMSVETFLVLIFYPLFVLSYRRLIVIKPLEDSIARAQQAAQTHQGKIMKYGIPGLLFFVWFPFWMTGPLVGSVIGFLIGLRTRVLLLVVLGGTYAAILCWGIVLQRVHEMLGQLGPVVSLVFVMFILLVAVSIHIRHAVSHRSRGKSG